MALHDHYVPPRYNYGQYLQWDGTERYELIDGELFDMSPAPSSPHQFIAGELYRQLATTLRRKRCRAAIAPFDVILPERNEKDEEVRTVVQPDVLVVCDPKKISRRGVRGAPDFVIEVLSPSRDSRDRVVKAALYERHGVREYWIVDPDEKTVDALRLGADSRWIAPVRYGADEAAAPVEALPGVFIDLREVFEGI
jgi:Uma2 family endonuclease